VRRLLALLVLALAAACGSSSPATLSAPTSSPTVPVPTYTPTPPPASSVHFDSPEAAMRYLAKAWNSGDIVSLKHVTDPSARDLLVDMHREATNLALDHCTANTGEGDYECYFTHDYPTGYVKKGHGTAQFRVGPADRPGWYMTYFEECN
jgi:hypothetical protein